MAEPLYPAHALRPLGTLDAILDRQRYAGLQCDRCWARVPTPWTWHAKIGALRICAPCKAEIDDFLAQGRPVGGVVSR